MATSEEKRAIWKGVYEKETFKGAKPDDAIATADRVVTEFEKRFPGGEPPTTTTSDTKTK